MSLGELDKFVNVWLDSFDSSLHGRDGVGLTLQSDALPPYCAEFVQCGPGCPATVMSGEVAAEDKHFVGFQLIDSFRCIFHYIR